MAASNAWEKFRPITAPSCATCFATGSRSRRAISDPCNVLGTTIASLEVGRPVVSSRTALVISSMKRGMPSV